MQAKVVDDAADDLDVVGYGWYGVKELAANAEAANNAGRSSALILPISEAALLEMVVFTGSWDGTVPVHILRLELVQYHGHLDNKRPCASLSNCCTSSYRSMQLVMVHLQVRAVVKRGT